MGRAPWSNRKVVEDCRVIDISLLARDGVFRKGPGVRWTYKWLDSDKKEKGSIGYWVKEDFDGTLKLEFTYTVTNSVTGKVIPFQYLVAITTSTGYLGGNRFWFRCPLERDGQRCGSRVGKLYLPPGAHYFGCRKCHNLTYRSQKEHDKKLDHLFDDPATVDYKLRRCDLKTAMLVMKAYQKFGRF